MSHRNMLSVTRYLEIIWLDVYTRQLKKQAVTVFRKGTQNITWSSPSWESKPRWYCLESCRIASWKKPPMIRTLLHPCRDASSDWLISLETFFPYVKMKPLLVYLVPIATGLLHVAPSEKRLCPLRRCSIGTGIPWWGPSYVFSRVKRPNSFIFSQQDRFSSLLITLLALPWTLSSLPTSFLNGEHQIWTQYPECGLIHAEYTGWPHLYLC